MGKFKDAGVRGRDWAVALALGGVAAVLYFFSMANYAFPGEGAHLMALWLGLDSAAVNPHPLMEFFARMLGCSNALGPICGAVSVVCVYHFTAFFVRERMDGELLSHYADSMSVTAGVAASLLFMLSPAVREASTHLSAFGFDAAWAFLAAVLLIPYARAGRKVAWLVPPAMGVLAGLGLADSPLFVLLAPLYVAGLWCVSSKRGGKSYGAAFAFVLVAIATFLLYAPRVSGDFVGAMRQEWEELSSWMGVEGSFVVAAFAVLPFLVSLYSSKAAYNEEGGLSMWVYHIMMSFVTILAVATPLSPSELMRPYGFLPVVPCAFVSFTAAYLVVYWWILVHAKVRRNESVDLTPVSMPGRTLSLVMFPLSVLVFGISALLALFSFDGSRGRFADQAADKLIDDLRGRTWFVTDGLLDDHIRLAAARKGVEVNLVCLQRDLDERYLEELAGLVEKLALGGDKCRELSLSLKLGVLTFVQDWFASDPEIASKVAIFGTPDLWYAAGIKAVPEFMFFGADPAAAVDWGAWREFDGILARPKGLSLWGSYMLWKERDPLELMRLRLRQHAGLLANDRGVYLQDAGDDDAAFDLYELVLTNIDKDNVCALFNEFEMARAGHAKAAGKKMEIEKALKAIVEDKDRRYILWKLANVYGYIRSPEIFIRLGYNWARSGRPGEALNQVRRAIDFVPTDRRTSILNMIAALYASGNDAKKSRSTYEQVLDVDAGNHDALIGLMRLELLDGNGDKAIEYLERALKDAKDDPRIAVELALLHLMKGNLPDARSTLRLALDRDPGDMRAWSLFVSVVLQQADSAPDAEGRARFLKEAEESVLPEMEKHATDKNDYYVQSSRAFLLMRKGEDSRKAARDALAKAAKTRPDIQATNDLVLDLDIQLNDKEDAEFRARDVLRRNRKAPLANYVMGSLELGRDNLDDAEMYLRRAADAPKPVVLAQNDLAEVLRRKKNYEEAERYARLAIRTAPGMYVGWETLGAILMDADGDLNEAERSINKACELSKSKDGREEDVRVLVTLARVQIAKGDRQRANMTMRKVQGRIAELSDFERREFEELRRSVK